MSVGNKFNHLKIWKKLTNTKKTKEITKNLIEIM